LPSEPASGYGDPSRDRTACGAHRQEGGMKKKSVKKGKAKDLSVKSKGGDVKGGRIRMSQ
jgi:hypothetical protein